MVIRAITSPGVVDDRPRRHLADGEDRRLRRVDHRLEASDAEHTQVRDGEGAPGEIGGGERAVAGEPAQASRLGGDLEHRAAVRIGDRRDEERVAGVDGEADVDPAVDGRTYPPWTTS